MGGLAGVSGSEGGVPWLLSDAEVPQCRSHQPSWVPAGPSGDRVPRPSGQATGPHGAPCQLSSRIGRWRDSGEKGGSGTEWSWALVGAGHNRAAACSASMRPSELPSFTARPDLRWHGDGARDDPGPGPALAGPSEEGPLAGTAHFQSPKPKWD